MTDGSYNENFSKVLSIRLSKKFLSFHEVITDEQQFLFYFYYYVRCASIISL